MMYLVSRSICQGRRAALVSLGGVGLGFLVYMLAAAFGITALLFAVPLAYDALAAGRRGLPAVPRMAGTEARRPLAVPGTRPPCGQQPQAVRNGFCDELLNPKAAMLYLSLLPQFIDPARGNVLTQSLVLGSLQIIISLSLNALDRDDCRHHCRLPGLTALLDGRPEVADGDGARGPGTADGIRIASVSPLDVPGRASGARSGEGVGSWPERRRRKSRSMRR